MSVKIDRMVADLFRPLPAISRPRHYDSAIPNAAIVAAIRADIAAAEDAIARANARVQNCLTLADQVGDTNPGIVAGLHHLAQVERDRAAYFEGRLLGLRAELARWTA